MVAGRSQKGCGKVTYGLRNGLLEGSKKVVGMSPIGCIIVAGRVQQGCEKVINRLWEGHL